MPWNGIPREPEKEEDQKTPFARGKEMGKTWGELKMVAKDRKKWKAAVIALCPPWDEAN